MLTAGDTITVLCACGKKLKAPATAVGRRAKCPACANVLTIELPPPPPKVQEDDPLGALYELAETEKSSARSNELDDSPRCPQCAGAMPSGAVLCTNCGFDSRTNQKIVAAAAPKPAALDYGRPEKKKAVDRMAAQGSFMMGLLLSFGLATVGGIVWFLVTWLSGLNFYLVCVLVGVCAGAGMKIGQKGYSTLGGWAAVGVTVIVMIGARLAIIIALLIPIIERAAATGRALAAASAARSTHSASAQPPSNGAVGNNAGGSTAWSSSSPASGTTPHPNLSQALGTLVMFLIFTSWLSTLFMIGACWVAYRTAAGSIG